MQWWFLLNACLFLNVVYGADTKRSDIEPVPYSDAYLPPYNKIGLLIFKNDGKKKNGRHRCVASVVGFGDYDESHEFIDLLTAGHCMCIYREGGWAWQSCYESYDVKFYQGVNSDMKTTASTIKPTHNQLIKIFFPLGWKTSWRGGEDLAIVRMKSRKKKKPLIEQRTPTLQLSYDSTPAGNTVNSVDMPAYRVIVRGRNGKILQDNAGNVLEAKDGFRMKRFVNIQGLKVYKTKFIYSETIFADNGMSGAPLIKHGTNEVIGILEGEDAEPAWFPSKSIERFLRFDEKKEQKIVKETGLFSGVRVGKGMAGMDYTEYMLLVFDVSALLFLVATAFCVGAICAYVLYTFHAK